jgi:hypothetical protein
VRSNRLYCDGLSALKLLRKMKMARNGGKGALRAKRVAKTVFFQERLYSDPVCNLLYCPLGQCHLVARRLHGSLR